jgi:hypothetical protein
MQIPTPPNLDPSLPPAEHWKAGYRAAVSKQASGFGAIGGTARRDALTPEQRSEIARNAGKAGGRGRMKQP